VFTPRLENLGVNSKAREGSLNPCAKAQGEGNTEAWTPGVELQGEGRKLESQQ
jgi:hypothetical protein